ncbi:putative N-acetyltransferase YafP [compost metagenome]
MELRKFADRDIHQIVSLFYETVHSVNKRDYTQQQLNAWAPKDEEPLKLKTWKDSLSHNVTYVAEIKSQIVGFSDMTQEGHLDRLFIHKPFFERLGYRVIQPQIVERKGAGLVNFKMVKILR